MDLYIYANLEELTKIFRLLDFKVSKKNIYFSAKLKTPRGRFHAMFSELTNRIYCDLHFDNKIHFLLFGVDYKIKPLRFFKERMEVILENRGIYFEIKDVDWFTRRNKAILRGFRL